MIRMADPPVHSDGYSREESVGRWRRERAGLAKDLPGLETHATSAPATAGETVHFDGTHD